MHTVRRDFINDSVVVQPLSVSQSTLFEILGAETASDGYAHTSVLHDNKNVGTLLALLIADKILSSLNDGLVVHLQEITTDVI